jgi:anti-anti-sigma regulatory factor
MDVTLEQAQGRVPVTVIRLDGELDASNFEALIQQGREVHAQGTRYVLLDMRRVTYMGSSGLVAIHSLALLLAGHQPPDPEAGWEAHHAMSQAVDSGMQEHLKVLLGDPPAPAILRVFERTGMNRFIEVLTNEAQALSSF